MSKQEKEAEGQALPRKNRYAWVIFGICFLMVFVALGFGSSTKGTYLTAVTGSLGLKRGLFTIADSCRFLTTAVMSFFLGKFVKTIGLRRMAGLGFVFLTLSVLVNSFGTAYWHFYAGGILLGAGMAWTTTTFVGYIVEKWFSNGKGTIMGIILAANGLGGVASEQIITRIIYGADGSLSYEMSRWREAYRITAVMFLAVGLLAFLLIRNDPREMGLEPLGGNMTKKKKRGASWAGLPFAFIKKQPYFYISGLCVFVMGFVLQSMTNMSKPYMYDLGLDKNYVLYVFSLHALMLCVAKVLSGVGYDTLGMRKTFGICCFAAMISLGSLYFLKSGEGPLPWVYSFISAFGMPLETVMIPLLVSEMYGSRDYARVLGYYTSLNTLGYAVGVPIVNWAYDKSGSYKGMILVLCIVMLTASLVAQFSLGLAAKDRRALENGSLKLD